MLISIVYKTNVSIFDAHTHLSYLVHTLQLQIHVIIFSLHVSKNIIFVESFSITQWTYFSSEISCTCILQLVHAIGIDVAGSTADRSND